MVVLRSKAYPIAMEIAGNAAMWTRPDSGDSPCSYPSPTYSAVRGLFESVLWGPAVLVIPKKGGVMYSTAVSLLCDKLQRSIAKC